MRFPKSISYSAITVLEKKKSTEFCGGGFSSFGWFSEQVPFWFSSTDATERPSFPF